MIRLFLFFISVVVWAYIMDIIARNIIGNSVIELVLLVLSSVFLGFCTTNVFDD